MRQIQELAAMFSGGDISMSGEGSDTGENPPFSAASPEQDENSSDGLGINPVAVMQLIGAASARDKNCDLLKALRPHLSHEKQQKLDRAVKLLKLYNIFITMRESGMLNDFEKML